MSHRTRKDAARAIEERRISRIDDIWMEATRKIEKRYSKATTVICQRTEKDSKQRRKEMNRASADYARRKFHAYIGALECEVNKLRRFSEGARASSCSSTSDSDMEETKVDAPCSLAMETLDAPEIDSYREDSPVPYSDSAEESYTMGCSSTEAEVGSPSSPSIVDWPYVVAYLDPESLPTAEELREQQLAEVEASETWLAVVS
jgi:hypothetical protein